MGFRSDGLIVNEDTPVSLGEHGGPLQALEVSGRAGGDPRLNAGQQVMILNPTTPIGSHDAKPTPTGRIFVDFLNRKFPAYVDTGPEPGRCAAKWRRHMWLR
jgi:dihydroflavonol-4-reductase